MEKTDKIAHFTLNWQLKHEGWHPRNIVPYLLCSPKYQNYLWSTEILCFMAKTHKLDQGLNFTQCITVQKVPVLNFKNLNNT